MQWEYLVLEEESWQELKVRQDALDRAAASGWELLSAVYNPERAKVMYFFKRPAQG